MSRPTPEKRGKLVSLATETDRTLFFDFLPLDMGTVKGFKVRFHLYTVPGQVFYDASRKLILRGCDGVIFVADSQRPAHGGQYRIHRQPGHQPARTTASTSAPSPTSSSSTSGTCPPRRPWHEMEDLLRFRNEPMVEAVANQRHRASSRPSRPAPARSSWSCRGADSLPPGSGRIDFPRSGVAQWQSNRLLTDGSGVQIPPPEPNGGPDGGLSRWGEKAALREPGPSPRLLGENADQVPCHASRCISCSPCPGGPGRFPIGDGMSKLHGFAALTVLGLVCMAARGGELCPEVKAKFIKVIASASGGKVACGDPAIRAALESAGVTIDGDSRIVWASNPIQAKAMKQTGRLVISGARESLSSAGVVLLEADGRPKILVNPANINASHVPIGDAILKIAERGE